MERKEERSRLRIAARIEKSPKPIGTQGFWTMVPVTGLDGIKERLGQVLAGGAHSRRIWMGSSPIEEK